MSKKTMDTTSKKSMKEHGIIVTKSSMFLENPVEVVHRQSLFIMEMLDKAEKISKGFRAVTEISQTEWDSFKNSPGLTQENLENLRQDFKDAKRRW